MIHTIFQCKDIIKKDSCKNINLDFNAKKIGSNSNLSQGYLQPIKQAYGNIL